jgi:hypothetical protein
MGQPYAARRLGDFVLPSRPRSIKDAVINDLTSLRERAVDTNADCLPKLGIHEFAQ